MRFVLFTHSLVSDWNHGNAHFLRGILRELAARGHQVLAFEPVDGWSRQNLLRDQGEGALERFDALFPELTVRTYSEDIDLDEMLHGADVVLVHEWTRPDLVQAIGRYRARQGTFALLFHDTHHRAVTSEGEIDALDLQGYDSVLTFGEVLSEIYRARGWGRRVFTWHEAADVRLYKPHPEIARVRDLVWVGNWGDGERSDELRTFLIEPARKLGLSATAFGVRYPADALAQLEAAGFEYRGWLPTAEVPLEFSRHRVTVHVPRRPYATRLPGIPTIRMFEALACGIPLVSAPWRDVEGLFREGDDYLTAESAETMQSQLSGVLHDRDLAEHLRANGLERILSRHTCAHRIDELFAILATIGGNKEGAAA